MNNEKFTSIEELYQKLLPALRTKKSEMVRAKMINIKEIDIWKYFCKYVWPNKNNLTLGEMVNDILSTDNFTIYTHVKGE